MSSIGQRPGAQTACFLSVQRLCPSGGHPVVLVWLRKDMQTTVLLYIHIEYMVLSFAKSAFKGLLMGLVAKKNKKQKFVG